MKVNLYFLAMAQIVALMLTLTGCSTGAGSAKVYLADKATVLLGKGNPPSYVDGYIDGCSSGKRMGGDKRFTYKKDIERAEREALYARGWQEGQITCQNETLAEDYYRQSERSGMCADLDMARQRRVEAESRAKQSGCRGNGRDME